MPQQTCDMPRHKPAAHARQHVLASSMQATSHSTYHPCMDGKTVADKSVEQLLATNGETAHACFMDMQLVATLPYQSHIALKAPTAVH